MEGLTLMTEELRRYMFNGAPKCLHVTGGKQCGRLAIIDAQWFKRPDANQVCPRHKQEQIETFGGMLRAADPFQDAAPCWQDVRGKGSIHGRLESWWDGEQMILGSRANNRKQMSHTTR